MSAPISAPTEIVDPQLAAFWASDPSILREPEPLPEFDNHEHVRREIAAAIIVVCTLIVRELLSRRPTDPAQAQAVARSAWSKHARLWLRLTVPAVKQAYLLGKVSGLTGDELEAMAGDYAASLGDYVDTTSADALADGFHQQLGQHWSESLAWHRASTAYGLDKRQMGSYVKGLMVGSDAGRTDPVPSIARSLAEKALLIRADRIGADESYSATQNGKAIAWLFLLRNGQLPDTARREWRTAKIESVCAICAPLDRQAVPLDEPFVLATGAQLWSPRAHPGCNCTIHLLHGEDLLDQVQKNVGTDLYNRDAHGEFATKESRGKRLRPVLEPDPAIEALLEQIESAATAAPSLFTPAKPSLFTEAKTLFPQKTEALFGRKTLMEPASLFDTKTSLFTETPTAQAQRQKQQTGRKINLYITMPPIGPRPGKGDGGGTYCIPYGRLNSDNGFSLPLELEWVRGKGVDFGDLNQAAKDERARTDGLRGAGEDGGRQIPGWRSEGLDASGEHHSDDEPGTTSATRSDKPAKHIWSVDEEQEWFWADQIGQVTAARENALSHADAIVDDLDDMELETIYQLAGIEPEPPAMMKARIKRNAASPPEHPGLLDAYADYVAYANPSMTGTDEADRLARDIANERESNGLDEIPFQSVLVFDSGFAPGDGPSTLGAGTASIDGKYRVADVEYKSRRHFDGDLEDPYAGLRLVYLEPTE